MASKPNNQNADADLAEKLKASEEAFAKSQDEAKAAAGMVADLAEKQKAAEEALAKSQDEAKAAAGRATQLATKLEAAEARISRLEADLREKTLPTVAAEKIGGVRIAARPAGGFRRAGMHHSAEPVDYPAGHFTAKQIEAMKADPNLSVIDI